MGIISHTLEALLGLTILMELKRPRDESVFYGPIVFTLDELFPVEVPSYVTVDESRTYLLPERRSLNMIVYEI